MLKVGGDGAGDWTPFGEVSGPLPQKTIPAPIPADNSPLQKATAGLMAVGGFFSGLFGFAFVHLGARRHGYARGL